MRKKGLRVHWYSLERKTRGSVFARGSKAQILEYTDDSEIIQIRTKSFCGNVGLPFTNDGRRSAIALDIKSVFGISWGALSPGLRWISSGPVLEPPTGKRVELVTIIYEQMRSGIETGASVEMCCTTSSTRYTKHARDCGKNLL